MKNLFSYDGWLATGCRFVWKIFILNVCYALTCVPVVTVGPATAALYAMFMIDHETGGNIKNYFREFASNFRRATPIGLLFLAVGGLLVFNIYALSTWTIPMQEVLVVVMALLCIPYLLALAYVFPLQAGFHNRVMGTVKNALILGLSMPLRGALMTMVTFLPVLLLAVDLQLFAQVFSLWLLFGFSLAACLNSLVAKKAFASLPTEPQKEEPEETEE